MIYIGLGNDCDLGIENDRLVIVQRDGPRVVSKIDMGIATERRIKNIQDYLGRLSIHAREAAATR